MYAEQATWGNKYVISYHEEKLEAMCLGENSSGKILFVIDEQRNDRPFRFALALLPTEYVQAVE